MESEETRLLLFGRDQTAPEWWVKFLLDHGMDDRTQISAIQVLLRRYDAEFVVRKTKIINHWVFTDRYLEFKNPGAKTFFAIQWVR